MILIVEDDPRVSSFLARGLKAEGYAVSVVPDAESALPFLRQRQCQLALLDLMLPGMGGLELCQSIRAERNPTPVLMLSAMGSVSDRVAGLRCGADDYLAKPFAFEELLARVEALLRRPAQITARDQRLEVGPLVFDRERMEVALDGQVLPLTARELALLELLMSSPGRVFSRERILSNVWGLDADPLTNVVEVYIRRLRGKIEQAEGPPMIHTVRGYGYRLDAAGPTVAGPA